MNFNKVILGGRLTRDVELRHTPSNTAVCDLGLAVNERVKQGDQWGDKTHFFDVTCWGRTAEVAAEYLAKGSPVLIDGRLSFESWEKDGQKRSKVKVTCEKLQLVGSKSERNEHDQSRPATNNQNQEPPKDDVPF